MNEKTLVPDLDLGVNKIRRCRHGMMVFFAADNAIGRSLELYGEFAESENRLMVSLLKPGDTVIDVGANVGTVTLACANRVGPSGKVIAFEPQRLVFVNLCTAVCLNGLTNVYPHPLAVADRPGTTTLPVVDPRRPDNYGAVRVGPSQSGDVVAVTTVDSLSLSDCALIKIDVEGMDYQVLQGARETIERTRPFVYLEAKAGENTAKAIRWMQDRDYDLFWHFAAFFSQDNFRGLKENVFGGRGDVNMICFPKSSTLRPNLPGIAGPDSDWREDYRRHLEQRSKQT